MDRVAIKSTTLFRELDGETVLVDIDSGTYFGLDEVGTFIWNQIDEGVSIEDIPSRMTEVFEVEEDVARTDLDAFIQQLLEKGLVEAAS